MGGIDFNNRASSIRIRSGTWEICDDGSFYGYCTTISGDIYDLRDYGLNNRISSVRRVYDDYYDRGYRSSGYYRDYQRRGGVGLYMGSGYDGDYFGVSVDIPDLQVYAAGYNGSLEVFGGQWEVCDQANYGGRCTVVEGRYDNLSQIGFGLGIGSIRRYY